MKTLYRKEYATVCNEYSMAVTEVLIAAIQRQLDENYKFVDDVRVEITEQDIIDAWNFEETDKLVINEVLCYIDGDYKYTFERPIALFDILRNILSDEIWDRPQVELDYSTDDFQDYVEDEEKEN